jgi:hypothetical protein
MRGSARPTSPPLPAAPEMPALVSLTRGVEGGDAAAQIKLNQHTEWNSTNQRDQKHCSRRRYGAKASGRRHTSCRQLPLLDCPPLKRHLPLQVGSGLYQRL